MSAPVFFAETQRLRGEHITLDGPEGRHAATVRRLRAGEAACLTDGVGELVCCVVTRVGRDVVEFAAEQRRRVPPPAPRIHVVQALAKGDRGERAVELATEVGADAITPWAAARCIARWRDGRRDKGLGRWRSTAFQAAKQSRRAWFPEVAELADTTAVAGLAAGAETAIVLHEEAARPLTAVPAPRQGTIVVIAGPEGGITDDELAAFERAGAIQARLGPTVLRTSTAGAAATVVLATRTGRW